MLAARSIALPTPTSGTASTPVMSVSPTVGSAPLTVTFSNLAVSAKEEDLDFGDGSQTVSNGFNGCWPVNGVVPQPCQVPIPGVVTHTYTTPGWMNHNQDMTYIGNSYSRQNTRSLADVSKNTMGGLHIFFGYAVPLSADKFGVKETFGLVISEYGGCTTS